MSCYAETSGKDGPAPAWKSGQGSPVHDADRLMPEGGSTISLENEHLRIDVNQRTGALTGLLDKHTGWQIQKEPRLASSFATQVRRRPQFEHSLERASERVHGYARYHAPRDDHGRRRQCPVRNE